MVEKKKKGTFVAAIQTHLLVGVLTVIPILATYWVFMFLLKLLGQAGGPLVRMISNAIRPSVPTLSNFLLNPAFQLVIGAALILLLIALIGWATTRVLGKRLIATFDGLMNRIPFVQTIYGAVKKLLDTFQQQPGGTQRVVLIDFPSPEMKTVGLVTQTFQDDNTGRELAAVYVPTTPNPTSGYLEIVPVDKVTPTQWTVDEAMTFIVSGGTTAPESMIYEKPPEDAGELKKPKKQDPGGDAAEMEP